MRASRQPERGTWAVGQLFFARRAGVRLHRGAARSGNRYLASRAAVEPDAFERLVDFFERLLPEIRDAQQVFWRAMQQVIDGEDAALLEAIRRAHGQANFGGAHVQSRRQILSLAVDRPQRNARHGGPSL